MCNDEPSLKNLSTTECLYHVPVLQSLENRSRCLAWVLCALSCQKSCYSDVILEVGHLPLNHCPGYERARLSEAVRIQLYRTLKIRQSSHFQYDECLIETPSLLFQESAFSSFVNRISIQSLDETRAGASTGHAGCCAYVIGNFARFPTDFKAYT